jgi:putative membrane protein
MFLFLLPFALVDRAGWLTPLVVMLASYPLFCLDEIGIQLQDPFSESSTSHLPLNTVCQNIENNVLSYLNSFEQIKDHEEHTPSRAVYSLRPEL